MIDDALKKFRRIGSPNIQRISLWFLQNGVKKISNVKHEVVVSGGAVGSPQLLLLSGIGPKEDLERVGIQPVHNLPGVGKNLHNHVSFGIDFTAEGQRTTSYNAADVDVYLQNQTGPLASTGMAQVTGILASKYTTPHDPDMQFFFAGYQESCKFDSAVDVGIHGNDNPVRFTAVNVHAKSRGTEIISFRIQLSHHILYFRICKFALYGQSCVDAVKIVLLASNEIQNRLNANCLWTPDQSLFSIPQESFNWRPKIRCTIRSFGATILAIQKTLKF